MTFDCEQVARRVSVKQSESECAPSVKGGSHKDSDIHNH